MCVADADDMGNAVLPCLAIDCNLRRSAVLVRMSQNLHTRITRTSELKHITTWKRSFHMLLMHESKACAGKQRGNVQ